MLYNTTTADNEVLYLIGFRLNCQSLNPEIYTLLIYGQDDRPIKLDNQIIFFQSPEQVYQVLNLCDDDIQKLDKSIEHVELVIDVAKMLHLINYENYDDTNTILDCLNILLDFIKSAKGNIPEQYRIAITTFADYLTFDQDIERFFLENSINRSSIVDAILWCVGAISVNSRLFTNRDFEPPI
jgi:hypothetical protein